LSSALDEKGLRNTSAAFHETPNLFICCIQVIATKPLKLIDLQVSDFKTNHIILTLYSEIFFKVYI